LKVGNHQMNSHPLTVASGPLELSKPKASAFMIDVWLAGLPLLASLIAMAFFEANATVIRLLVILLFITSTTLFILWMRRGLRAGKLAGIAVVAGFVGWYSFPGFVSLFNPSGRFGENLPIPIDNETVIWSVAYLSLFLLSWIVTAHLFSRRFQVVPNTGLYTTRLRRIVLLAFAAALVGFIPYIASGLTVDEVINLIFQSRAVDKPWLFTDNLGNTTSAFVYLAQSAIVAGACLLWIITQDKRLGRLPRVLAGIMALLISVGIFFDQGTRSITALVVMPVLLLISIELWRHARKRIFVWIAIVAVALVFILQFQLFFRSSYTRADTSDLLLHDLPTLGGTSDYFTETMLAVQIVPAYHDFFHESVIEQFIVSPIPRFIWPGKPATQVVWFYSLLRWGVDVYQTGGNTFPGIVGQYYMSWGWLGPIMIGLMLGLATARTDAYLAQKDFQKNLYEAAVGILLAVWLFISFRVLSPGFFYPIIFVAVIVFLSRTRLPPHEP
jgi:oligosaccharide repeat unit polymerase